MASILEQKIAPKRARPKINFETLYSEADFEACKMDSKAIEIALSYARVYTRQIGFQRKQGPKKNILAISAWQACSSLGIRRDFRDFLEAFGLPTNSFHKYLRDFSPIITGIPIATTRFDLLFFVHELLTEIRKTSPINSQIIESLNELVERVKDDPQVKGFQPRHFAYVIVHYFLKNYGVMDEQDFFNIVPCPITPIVFQKMEKIVDKVANDE